MKFVLDEFSIHLLLFLSKKRVTIELVAKFDAFNVVITDHRIDTCGLMLTRHIYMYVYTLAEFIHLINHQL